MHVTQMDADELAWPAAYLRRLKTEESTGAAVQEQLQCPRLEQVACVVQLCHLRYGPDLMSSAFLHGMDQHGTALTATLCVVTPRRLWEHDNHNSLCKPPLAGSLCWPIQHTVECVQSQRVCCLRYLHLRRLQAEQPC